MRTIIAGSRTVTSYKDVLRAVMHCGWTPTVVICGDAPGADRLGATWARLNKVPVEHFPADWEKFKNRAGYLRNEQMVQNAEALIAIWDGRSRGTEHTIRLAQEAGLKIHVERV